MFLIKIYIKESYINYYHTIIQMCGQYCILAPFRNIIFILSDPKTVVLVFELTILCNWLSSAQRHLSSAGMLVHSSRPSAGWRGSNRTHHGLKKQEEEECIPVGCVAPACCPYLPACTAQGGRGVPGGTCRGGYLPKGVYLQGGRYLPGEVYLPGGVPANSKKSSKSWKRSPFL